MRKSWVLFVDRVQRENSYRTGRSRESDPFAKVKSHGFLRYYSWTTVRLARMLSFFVSPLKRGIDSLILS
jgi:hypothetical protein